MKTQAVLLIVGGLAVAGGLILWNNRSGNGHSTPVKASPTSPTGQSIAWVRSYPDGMTQAKATGKPMLVHFHGPG